MSILGAYSSPWTCDEILILSEPKAAAGAAFYGTKCAVAQIRHKDDMWNAPVGGLVAGIMLGLRCKQPQRGYFE